MLFRRWALARCALVVVPSRTLEDLACRFEAVDPGHADVHQDHVWACARRFEDRLIAVGCLCDDFDLVVECEDGVQGAARQRVVVGDENADAHG